MKTSQMRICGGKTQAKLTYDPQFNLNQDPDGRQLLQNVVSNEIPNFPGGSACVSAERRERQLQVASIDSCPRFSDETSDALIGYFRSVILAAS